MQHIHISFCLYSKTYSIYIYKLLPFKKFGVIQIFYVILIKRKYIKLTQAEFVWPKIQYKQYLYLF